MTQTAIGALPCVDIHLDDLGMAAFAVPLTDAPGLSAYPAGMDPASVSPARPPRRASDDEDEDDDDGDDEDEEEDKDGEDEEEEEDEDEGDNEEDEDDDDDDDEEEEEDDDGIEIEDEDDDFVPPPLR
jgi:hypothetical protein